jgi:hypothetical protein
MTPGGAALALHWQKTLPAVPDPSVRVGVLRHDLLTRPMGVLAPALDAVAARAEEHDEAALEVLAAAVLAMADPSLASRRDELSVVARSHGLTPLARLLPLRIDVEGDEEEPPPLPRTGVGRTLTLGERRALARRPTRAALEKLLFDPHPLVVKNLLANPRLVEDDVLRIAARRPAVVPVLREVAQHVGWMTRPRVRLALLQNPSTPLELALPLVALLTRSELRQVTRAMDLPQAVRAAALARLGGALPDDPAPEAGG